MFVLLVIIAWLLADSRYWRKRDRITAVWTYVLTVPSLYLCVLYAGQTGWPGYGELMDWVFGPPSDWIVRVIETLG